MDPDTREEYEDPEKVRELESRIDRLEGLLKEVFRPGCLDYLAFDSMGYPTEEHPMKGKKALFRKDN